VDFSYPTETAADKLQVPFIEKQNGNILTRQNQYDSAITHYDKALVAMKTLFDENLIQTREMACRYICDIEIPVCLNLALCYLKQGKYHYCINFCSQAIDKDCDNQKALYRRGVSYLNVGELNKSKGDLLRANDLAEGKDGAILLALQQLKDKQAQDKVRERELSQRLLNQKKPLLL
jgi:tetratricopeptide (TPR) repeat protein